MRYQSQLDLVCSEAFELIPYSDRVVLLQIDVFYGAHKV